MSRLSIFLKDKNKKNFFRLLYEMGNFSLVKKELPKVYIGKRLYKKEVNNYLEYLSSKEIDRITNSKNLHKPLFSGILRNKLFFAYHLEKINLPTPKLYGYNFSNYFVFNGEKRIIDDLNQLQLFLEDFIATNASKGIFVKPLDDNGGKGCHLLTPANLSDKMESDKSALLSGDFIYQAVVQQHHEINAIYAKSINTIRFTTFMDKAGNTHILSAMMRFGNNGSVVDNSSSGGFYVSVDLENGILTGQGNQAMKHGGKTFDKHPETSYVLNGFKIPYYKEACALLKETNKSIPERIVGWDIAISEKGPVLIEGNDNNSWFGVDIAHGGLLKNPMMTQILNEA
ncbi:MAG: sugar-transfer associated ATP-grasp domain-containing protein [Leeuwenhoekiella sp.]